MPFLATSFTIAKLPILILAVCEAKDAVDLNRLIYLLLTIQLNRLTVFLVPLLPKPQNSTELSEYEQYVLDALFVQKSQALGRELTLGERRTIRMEYMAGLHNAKTPRKRVYKKTSKTDEIKDFQWRPSASMRKIRPREQK